MKSARSITPLLLPFGPDGLTDATPIRVRVEPVERLEAAPLWQAAPLTAYARSAIPPRVRRALAVTPVGAGVAVGLVLVLDARAGAWWRAGRGLSERHGIGGLGRWDRQIVVTAGRVEAEAGVDEMRGLGRVADAMAGTAVELPPPTAPRPPRIARRDAEALADLGW